MNATAAASPPGVILRRERLDAEVERCVAAPDPSLAALVERYWSLRWTSPPSGPGSLVPQFCVNISWELGSGRPGTEGRLVVTGVSSGRFDAPLTLRGTVVGIKLLPGAFTAITGIPASALLDRTVPASEVLDPELVTALTAAATAEPEHQVAALDAALAPLAALPLPAGCLLVRRALEVAGAEGIGQVEALAARLGVGARALQRAFGTSIGLSPKQVLVRQRLQGAIAALEAGPSEDLAQIATRLGFADQAHLTREVTRTIGVPPQRYRRGAPLVGPSR